MEEKNSENLIIERALELIRSGSDFPEKELIRYAAYVINSEKNQEETDNDI